MGTGHAGGRAHRHAMNLCTLRKLAETKPSTAKEARPLVNPQNPPVLSKLDQLRSFLPSNRQYNVGDLNLKKAFSLRLFDLLIHQQLRLSASTK